MPTYNASGSVTLQAEEVEQLDEIIEHLKSMGHPGYISPSIGLEVRRAAEQIDAILSRAK